MTITHRLVLSALLFLLLPHQAGFAQPFRPAVPALEESKRAKGPVRSIEATAHSTQFSRPRRITVTFHRNGNIRTAEEFPANGRTHSHYTFNEQEQFLSVETVVTDSDVRSYIVYEYDSSGRMINTSDWTTSPEDEDTTVIHLTYDGTYWYQGFTAFSVSPDGDSVQIMNHVYSHDTLRTAAGADSVVRTRFVTSEINSRTTFDSLCNMRGELLETSSAYYWGSDTIPMRNSRTYYRDNREVLSTVRNRRTETLSETRRTYSDSGTLKQVYTSVTPIESKRHSPVPTEKRLVYNTVGQVEHVYILGPPPGTYGALPKEREYHYTYEYDKHGNWIRKTCTTPYQQSGTCNYYEETRVIEYYE